MQWAELKGLVTEVHSNTISLQLPEGRLDLELDGYFASELKPHLKSVVGIRGVFTRCGTLQRRAKSASAAS